MFESSFLSSVRSDLLDSVLTEVMRLLMKLKIVPGGSSTSSFSSRDIVVLLVIATVIVSGGLSVCRCMFNIARALWTSCLRPGHALRYRYGDKTYQHNNARQSRSGRRGDSSTFVAHAHTHTHTYFHKH